MHWSQQTPSFKNIRENSTQGHNQMVNTEIRLIISSAAKDGKVLHSQPEKKRKEKRKKKRTEADCGTDHNSSLPNSYLN